MGLQLTHTSRPRQVICLLGLPIDVLTMDETVQRIREAARTQQRIFLSTPNLNFLIGCMHDADFRKSVIDSDMSVADGMPLIWMSRLLGVPLPERVTGSGLFERLHTGPLPEGEEPIKVYFFGGQPGAAEAAYRSLNSKAGGLTCVGYETPGFGSVEDMSTSDVLARINASGADFLIVALGAVKGQRWIQRNRSQLRVPIISHLGAVVNFAAGNINRAPAWMQKTGLEWLWRIKEEPMLWRRYWSDGKSLLNLVFNNLIPHALWLRRHTPKTAGRINFINQAGYTILEIQGFIPDPIPEEMLQKLEIAAISNNPVTLDLTQCNGFRPSFAGQLLLLKKYLDTQNQRLEIKATSTQIDSLLKWNRLNFSTENNK